jgi:hypothetical protein
VKLTALGFAALSLLASAVVFLVPAASGKTNTTEPNVYADIDVTINDRKIIISDRSAQRGEGVNFHVRNVGRRIHNFTLLADQTTQLIGLSRSGLSSGNLKPKGTAVLQVFMDLRGTYIFRSTVRTDRAKPGMHGKFVVS